MPAPLLSHARRRSLPAPSVPVETCRSCLRLVRPVPASAHTLSPWEGLALLLEIDARARHRADLLRATRRRASR